MNFLSNTNIFNMVMDYNVEIILGLTLGVFLLLIFNIISQFRISGIRKKYDELVKGSDKENLEDLLLDVGRNMDSISNNLNVMEREVNSLDRKLSYAVQKVGVIRYDAFDDLGSEQSFSLACLDEHNSGFILTSIFGRDYSSNYVKPIEDGKPEYKLSVEEMQALDRAMK